MAKFEIFTGEDNQFHFRLKADNGEIILASEAYEQLAGAKNGIESVRTHADDADRYQLYESLMNGEFYFTLRAANNEVIGVSEMYTTLPNASRGVETVKRTVPKAKEVVELPA